MNNKPMNKQSARLRLAAALMFPILATAAGFACEAYDFSYSNIVILYLLAAVLWTLVMPGYGQGLLSSLVSMLCCNYFFTPPRYTFSVSQPSHLVTFALMCTASLITSFLMTRILQAKSRNELLYLFQRQLAAVQSKEQIEHLLQNTLASQLQLPVRFGNAGPQAQAETALKSREWIDGRTFLPESVSQDLPALFLEEKRWNKLSASTQHTAETLIANAALAISRLQAARTKEQALEEAARIQERNRLLQSVSHDLRTPLTSITLDAEQLQKEESSAQRQVLCADIIDQTRWLLTMSTNILQLSRLQSDGRLPADRLECLPAEEVVAGALCQFEKTHPNTAVESSVPEEPLFVSMDPVLIQQALINLLENAARFSPPDKPLRLKVSHQGDQALFSVCNAGKPISPETFASLFEPFSGTDRKHRHYGLGLAVCRTIAQVHGGSLKACNIQNNSGVCFTLRLPLNAAGFKASAQENEGGIAENDHTQL